MNLLFIEPFYGGSHKAVADAWIKRSRHRFDLIEFSPFKWKWRMRATPVALRKLEIEWAAYDAVVASDMLDLATLRGLVPNLPPTIIYWHENQLAYPNQVEQSRDAHFAFTNFTTAYTAHANLFNSQYHLDNFFERMDRFLAKMPGTNVKAELEEIRAKSEVVYPGIAPIESQRAPNERPVVLWNHRWEHDKNPELFFDASFALAEEGLTFDLILLGERFRNRPPIFAEAQRRLGEHILTDEYAETTEAYWRWLHRADIVVSTTNQENFGLSVMEAISAGCRPILPNRLSYPELIPEAYHNEVFYRKDEMFLPKLRAHLLDRDRLFEGGAEITQPYRWDVRVEQFDEAVDAMIQTKK